MLHFPCFISMQNYCYFAICAIPKISEIVLRPSSLVPCPLVLKKNRFASHDADRSQKTHSNPQVIVQDRHNAVALINHITYTLIRQVSSIYP